MHSQTLMKRTRPARLPLETLERRLLLCGLDHTHAPPSSDATPWHHGATEAVLQPSATLTTGAQEADALPDLFPSLSGGFVIDQSTQSGRTLLKFGTQVNNQGAGPAILISGRPGIDPIPPGAPISSWLNANGSHNILQQVFTFNGTSFQHAYYRLAEGGIYHPGHGHLHYAGYASHRLRHSVGGVPGDYVIRPDGTPVVAGKVGFCLTNVATSFTMENGQSSTTLPGYGRPGQPSVGCSLTQGVHVGYADIYGSSLTGQWIDVTGLPNGQYFLELELDHTDAILESNENNNTRTFPVNLNVNPTSGGIPADPYDATGPGNQTFAAATDMGVMGVFTRTGLTVHWGYDFDYYRFVAASSGTYTLSETHSSGNADLYLYDANGVQLGASTSDTATTESITHNFVAGQMYYALVRSYNSTVVSNYQISWNIKPTVEAEATDPQASEYQNNIGVISIARNGPVASPLTVSFSVGGTATRGVDYQIYHNGNLVSGNTIEIGSGASAADLEIRPIVDDEIEPTETVLLTLSGSAAYVVGAGSTALVDIADTPPQVSQAAQVWQTAPHKLLFQFTLDVSASLALVDIDVRNRDTNEPITPVGLDYDHASNTATVTFAGVLPDGRYRARLNAEGIRHAMGAPLPEDYLFNFFVLTGDANHDGRVNLDDFNVLAANFGQSGRDASTGDFTYDGIVNLDDFNVLAGKFGMVLNIGGRAAPGSSPFAGGQGIGENDDRLEQLA